MLFPAVVLRVLENLIPSVMERAKSGAVSISASLLPSSGHLTGLPGIGPLRKRLEELLFHTDPS
jgi:hypothetical protein